MFSRYDSKKLIKNCSPILSVIREAIIGAADRVTDNQIAWGQFLDYERSTGQTGVYGTVTAVKTLALLDEPDSSDYINHGLNWLRHCYEAPESVASRKMDWGVVYKHSYFLEALVPKATEINADSPFASWFQTLIDRRLPGNGWGEFYYSADNKDPDGSVIATAMALYVLRRYIPFSRAQQGKDAALWLCHKLNSQPALSTVELALSIIALKEYSLAHQDLLVNVTPLVDKLKRDIRKLGRVTNLPEYQHHFTVLNEDAEKSRNRYIFLPINAIVSYSLLISDTFNTTKDYINRSVAIYQKSISINKGYCNPEEAPRKSTVNQFWVTLLLKEYSNINPLGRFGSIFLKLKSKRFVYYSVLALLSLVLIAVAYFTLQHFRQNTNLSFISIILLFITDRILSRIWKIDK